MCFDLPAPSPPGCNRPRPAHKHCPQAGGQHRTAVPEQDGAHATPLRDEKERENENMTVGDIFMSQIK